MNPMQRNRLLAMAGVLLFCGMAGAADPAGAELIINEILGDPASDWDADGAIDFMGDEWVEVLNSGTEPVDLAEYWLRDGLGDTPHLHLDGILEPGAVKVYFGSQAVAWQVENGAGATGFSLNNGGDTVQLLKNHYVDGNLMSLDVVHSLDYADHEAEDDRSSGWSNQDGGWTLFDSLNPYTGSLLPGGSGCAPTPGGINICGPQVGAREVSFGGLKANFR